MQTSLLAFVVATASGASRRDTSGRWVSGARARSINYCQVNFRGLGKSAIRQPGSGAAAASDHLIVDLAWQGVAESDLI